jgi:hypothetical protein
LCRARVTLAVHPLCGEEIVVLAEHGEQCVRAETADGKQRLLAVDWTSLRPRPEPLVLGGRAVRLAPTALRALSGWVAARTPAPSRGGQKVASPIAERDNGSDGGEGTSAPAAGAVAAVVGQARLQSAARRGGRGTRGGR